MSGAEAAVAVFFQVRARASAMHVVWRQNRVMHRIF